MKTQRSSGTGSARSIALRSAVLALAIIAAGCGGDDANQSAEGTPDSSESAEAGRSSDGEGGEDEAAAGSEGPISTADIVSGDGHDADERAEDEQDEQDADEITGPTEVAEDVTDDGEGSEDDPGAASGDRTAGDRTAGDGETDDSETDDGETDDGAAEEDATAVGPTLAQVGPDDSGEDVVALQDRLAELGFTPGPADGDFGRRTQVALRTFQELAELPPTGRADRRTVHALATFRYDGLSLAAGDEGPDVERLQRRLADGPFDPGPVDGVYGSSTVAAVWALEKLAKAPVDGDWGPVDELAWRHLVDGRIGRPEREHDQRWVEVDLSQQVVKIYDPGSSTPILISHASSGSGIPWENEDHSGSSVTPIGDFHINRRISGWRESSLNIGRLYNPLYFNGGIAFHGATSVPLYPASHGCIRLPMHVADYLPSELPDGTPVHVLA